MSAEKILDTGYWMLDTGYRLLVAVLPISSSFLLHVPHCACRLENIAAIRNPKYYVWALGVTLFVSMPVRADIYRYVDREGIIHFTNVPTIPGYRLYMREGSLLPADDVSSCYDVYIAEAARKHGVSFSLIKAVIKAESDFDPYAVSKSGACGLMQIMPETAKALGVIDAFDPRENIFGGARYLKKLLTQFQGSLPLTLAAYNAGPKKVQFLKSVPPIEETRRFVRRVMQYLNRY